MLTRISLETRRKRETIGYVGKKKKKTDMSLFTKEPFFGLFGLEAVFADRFVSPSFSVSSIDRKKRRFLYAKHSLSTCKLKLVFDCERSKPISWENATFLVLISCFFLYKLIV